MEKAFTARLPNSVRSTACFQSCRSGDVTWQARSMMAYNLALDAIRGLLGDLDL
jgi:hypothetical protein